MTYRVLADPRVVEDLQEAIDYYEAEQKGLAQYFGEQIEQAFLTLERNPFFQIRYDNVRCLPIKKFPYMFHFTINESTKTIHIRALINTYKNII